MTDHLTDEQLNEYLDASPVTSSPATCHLDACADCRARLDDLRAVFAALESLSEVRPPSELKAFILARLPQKQTSPAWKWIFAAQTIGALAIAVWLASSFELPAAMLAYQPPTFDTLFTSLFTFISSSLNLPIFDPSTPLRASLQLFDGDQGMLSTLYLQPETLALLVVSIAALWLVGNGLLLRAPAPRSR